MRFCAAPWIALKSEDIVNVQYLMHFRAAMLENSGQGSVIESPENIKKLLKLFFFLRFHQGYASCCRSSFHAVIGEHIAIVKNNAVLSRISAMAMCLF